MTCSNHFRPLAFGLAVALALALAGCEPVPPPLKAFGYRPAQPPQTILLGFVQGEAAVLSQDAENLRHLRSTLDPRIVTVLVEAQGPLAMPRAQVVARLSHHPVRLRLVGSVAPDAAWLMLPPSVGIDVEACDAAPASLPGGFEPESDFARLGKLLPPGCSVDSILAAQTTVPSDLVQGRPLPPGVALPWADLIEAYDSRHANGGGAGGGHGGGGGGGGGGILGGGNGGAAGGGAAGGGAAGTAGATAGGTPNGATDTGAAAADAAAAATAHADNTAGFAAGLAAGAQTAAPLNNVPAALLAPLNDTGE